MRRLSVREGQTGILRLKDKDDREEQYVPSYDLDRARDLLLEFQEIEDAHKRSIKQNYWQYGVNWFPTVVNYLHGRVFMSYVKYAPLVKRMLNEEIEFIFEGSGDFSRLVQLLLGERTPNVPKAALFNSLVGWNNRRALRQRSAEVLFFRFGPDDFRTRAAKAALDELGAHYLEAFGAEKYLLLRNPFRQASYYLYGGVSVENRFQRTYRLSRFDRDRRLVFSRAIEKIERIMSGFIREFEAHVRHLASTQIHTLYGIDDSQVIYPLLYACQERGIRTVAHQHGAAYNKRHASYVMEGVDRREYRWFDTLIAWGPYWKERVIATCRGYPADHIVIGSDLYGDSFRFPIESQRRRNGLPRNVLVPYEFLTNTCQVGRYVRKLMDLGYRIWFKPRTDENLNDQIDAYCLPVEYRHKLRIVESITPSLMEEIDIVAGTMTTLVYQLLPYHKIFWVFDTDYRYMDDLVEAGLAHRIRYEDLDALNERFFVPTQVDPNYFFSPESLKETLSRYVLTGAESASHRAW